MSDWREEKLGKLCTIKTGNKDVNQGSEAGNYPFFTCAQKIYKIDNYVFDGEAILIAGNGFFNVKYYDGKFDAYQRTYVLMGFNAYGKYLYHFIKYRLSDITSDSRGSTIKYIRIGDLQNYPISLPATCEEQQLIVERLEERLAKLNTAREKLKKIPLILKRFRQSVLDSACSGKLTASWHEGKQLPEWDSAVANSLFEYVTSGSRGWAKYYSDEGALFIRIGNLNRNTIDLDFNKIQHVQPPENGEGTRTKLKLNDILISITADLGMIALVQDDTINAYINQHIALARPNAKNSARYLAWVLASPNIFLQLTEKQRGATKTGLGLDDIRTLSIPLPPLPEQEEIVRRVDKFFAIADSIEQRYNNAKEKLDKAEKALYAKAFKGEL